MVNNSVKSKPVPSYKEDNSTEFRSGEVANDGFMEILGRGEGLAGVECCGIYRAGLIPIEVLST